MDEPLIMLPGETVCVDVSLGTGDGANPAVLLYPGEAPLPISLIITYYRIHATPSPDTSLQMPCVSLPLCMVESYKGGTEAGFSTITIQTKHVWSFVVGFSTEAQFRPVFKTLGQLLAPISLQRFPAFEIRRALDKLGGTDDASAGADFSVWKTDAGWAVYNQEKELARQTSLDPATEPLEEHTGIGIDLRPWFRVSTLGQPANDYGAFGTYPTQGIVVPSSSSDEQLLKGAPFRSRNRIPAISYVCLHTGAVLARCAQPLTRQPDAARYADGSICLNLCNPYDTSRLPTGKVQSVDSPRRAVPPSKASDDPASPNTFVAPPSLVDDEWLNLPSPQAAAAPPQVAQRTLNVVDLRPVSAATGNQALGGGYESGSPFNTFCRVTFSGIENIHAVSSSWVKLRQLVQSSCGRSGRDAKREFLKELHETNWLVHVQRVLSASLYIAELIAAGRHVLTHCTDGWDRTSQATSLAMLLIDPFYRTVRGFCLLIEKEFCSFGHKFAERNGHDMPGETIGTAHTPSVVSSDVDRVGGDAMTQHKKQPSPIFTQWIDCVYQLMRQFPSHFEFTPALLEFISVHAYSCFFGTFLCNCHKERVLEGVTTRTVSLWTEVERRTGMERRGEPTPHIHRFLNPIYECQNAVAAGATFQFLKMSVGAKRLVFWEDFYLRFDSDLWHMGPSMEQRCLDRLPPVIQDPSLPLWSQAVADRPQQRASDSLAYAERAPTVIRRIDSNAMGAADTTASNLKTPLDPKAKQCWHCLERFGLFRPAQPCTSCLRVHCSRCLFTSSSNPRAKLCASCRAMEEVE